MSTGNGTAASAGKSTTPLPYSLPKITTQQMKPRTRARKPRARKPRAKKARGVANATPSSPASTPTSDGRTSSVPNAPTSQPPAPPRRRLRHRTTCRNTIRMRRMWASSSNSQSWAALDSARSTSTGRTCAAAQTAVMGAASWFTTARAGRRSAKFCSPTRPSCTAALGQTRPVSSRPTSSAPRATRRQLNGSTVFPGALCPQGNALHHHHHLLSSFPSPPKPPTSIRRHIGGNLGINHLRQPPQHRDLGYPLPAAWPHKLACKLDNLHGGALPRFTLVSDHRGQSHRRSRQMRSTADPLSRSRQMRSTADRAQPIPTDA